MSQDSNELKRSKREELERLRRRQPFQGKERLRLVFMVVGLAAAIGIFVWLQSGLSGDGDPNKTPGGGNTNFNVGAEINFPPVDMELLAEVKDDSSTDRLLLEAAPFSELLKLSKALLPGHLDALGSPRFPFENIEANASQLRGSPFRERGAVLDLSIERRTIDGPEETWVLLETDEGNRYWFATLKAPTELFTSGGNYVVTDGFFYKLYTRRAEDDRVTAPLLVGRELRPSVREAEPAKSVDAVRLADVRDADFFEETEVEDDGYWHLMNVAANLFLDEERMAAEFERAAPLDRSEVKTLAETPELYRGQPYRIFGRSVKSWTKACQENELRLGFSSHTFLMKYELGDQYIRLVAPGAEVLDDLGLGVEMLAYFHKMWAYIDGDGNARRVPVFFVSGFRERSIDRSPLEGQLVLGFIGLFVVMVVGFTWLVRRDRRQSEAAAHVLRERRRQMRENRRR